MADHSETLRAGYYAQMTKLLTEDRSMYTSLIPKDIVHLILNYVVSKGFIFGGDWNGASGFGRYKKSCVPLELEGNIKDIVFGNSSTILLIDGELYFSGAQTPLGINDHESKLLSELYPNSGFFRDIDSAVNTHRYRYINISKIKSNQLAGQKVVKIASGAYHSLILTDRRNCYSFGDNNDGQLGIGHSNVSRIWNLIGKDILDIACGEDFSCYLTTAGKIYTFGANGFGQLGLGDTRHRLVPTPVSRFSNITKIFASDRNTAFVADVGGQSITYVFGAAYDDKIGLSSPVIYSDFPVMLVDEFNQPILGVQKICFDSTSMLVLANNILYVCGSNHHGQLGLGDIKHVTRATIHPDFVDRNVTDIALHTGTSLIVADKICYSAGSPHDCRLGLGHENYARKYTQLPLFTDSFVNNIQSVKVRIGVHLSGLIII
jgi:alpha-tubulin suppressor-like RCC1 family protein